MKRFIFLALLSSVANAADIKISDLPLSSAASVGVNDSFPFVDATTSTTRRLKVLDLSNLVTLNASGLNYTPAIPSQWSIVPSKVNSALDNIVANVGRRTANAVSADFTVPYLFRNYILTVDSTAGNIFITLPDAIASEGFCVDMKQIGSYSVTATPIMSQTIDGNPSDVLTDINEAKHYCAVNGNWFNF
jgi:hypothetical protein